MSQTNIVPTKDATSPSSFDDDVDENNEIVLSTSLDTLSCSNDGGWANFDTFENKTNQSSETVPVTTSNIYEDDWTDAQSSTKLSMQLSNDKQTDRVNGDEDIFGDYREVQVSSPINSSLSTEQIESLISTCFPLESPTFATDTENFISTELPSFTTFKDQNINQFSCFKSSLSLWNVLSNISNDPIGIKYQWRKSTTERLFHQSLGVHERFHTKIVPIKMSNIDHENKVLPQSIDPHFDWKQSGLENPLADIDSSSLSTHSSKSENNVLDINKTLDLDYYVPPIKSSSLNREEQIASPTIVHRNNSPIIQQRSTPIKTIDLFPGSTTVLSDDNKPVSDPIPNFSFMNAKALMSPIQLNGNNNG